MNDGWVALVDLIAARAFAGPTAEARERAARRWAVGLPAGLAEKSAGAWMVSDTARLPDGVTVRCRLAMGPERERLAGHRLPAGYEMWGSADFERFLDTHELLRRFGDLRARLRGMTEERVANVLQQESGEWAGERGLSCALSTINRYRRRLPENGNVDSRGRKQRAEEDRARECHPEAWAMFQGFYLRENRLTVAECWRLVGTEAKQKGWAWPGLRTVQRMVEAIPLPIRIMAREGERKHDATCLPKVNRDYSEIPAGTWWIGDVRTVDAWCRVPDSRKGWRAVRPKITAWLDARSRMFVGWFLGVMANGDTILSAFRVAAGKWGLPTDCTCDNGEDYRSVGGKGRKWDAFDAARVGGAMQECGITIHWATPYTPWAKLIESHFRLMKEHLDKHLDHYCGGSPQERPTDLTKRLKDVMSVPTLDELRAAIAAWMEAHHATAQTGSGIDGLTPNLAMERYRGTVRTAAPAVLDQLCCKMVGPVKVGRDGVRHNGIMYGANERKLYHLQGREVKLRIDPANASFVSVCDLAGVPICKALNNALHFCGATQEDVRKAHQHRGRMRKMSREYAAEARTLIEDPQQTALRLKLQAAKAAEAELRKALPAVEVAPGITIVRPDLHDAAKRLETQPIAQGILGDAERITLDDLAGMFGLDEPPEDNVPKIDLADLDDLLDGERPVRAVDGWSLVNGGLAALMDGQAASASA